MADPGIGEGPSIDPTKDAEKATLLFDKAIYGIRDSQVDGLRDIAGRTVDRIRNREIAVVANNHELNVPTITGFELLQIPGQRVQYIPSIVMDVGKMMGANQEAIQGDLARTVAIADQFPLNGFQRRYHEIYGDALDAQKKWLEGTKAPTILFDPRVTDREALLKNLLGDARYFSDVGYEDWQNAIEAYRGTTREITDLSMLKQLENASGHFLSMRQRFLPQNHQLGLQHGGDKYLTDLTQDRRTEAMATALVGASLYGRGTDTRS